MTKAGEKILAGAQDALDYLRGDRSKGCAHIIIKTESDYKRALKRIESLFAAKPGTPEGEELELLATAVSAYEDIHYRINENIRGSNG